MDIVSCALPCPKTQEHQSTWVDSWVHRVHENGHQPLGRGFSLLGFQLVPYCDQTRSWNATLWISHPVYSLAERLRNTKVPVWTHELIQNPKVDISHWETTNHYGVQLAQYCHQTWSCNATLWISPTVYSLALRLNNTKAHVWTHEYMGHPKMDISHRDKTIHYGVQLIQHCVQTRSCNATLWISPPMYSFALRLRNTIVPVWTDESIGYPKIDISHRDAAIHYGAQLDPYYDKTRSCNAFLWISQPVYSLALRLRNTKLPVWTHESIGYPNMDISHWQVSIHCGVQLVQYCDQTRYCKLLFEYRPPSVLPRQKTQEHQSTWVDSWVHWVPKYGHQPLGRGNSLWRSACPIVWSNPILYHCFLDITRLCSPLPCD